jgi:hypothetical protein
VKKCLMCKKFKSLEAFAWHPSATDNLFPYCRECRKNYDHRRNHGISLAEKDAIYHQQSSRCCACGMASDVEDLVIDRHDDGINLICRFRCHHILVNFRQDLALLTEAQAYLQYHATHKTLRSEKRYTEWWVDPLTRPQTLIREGVQHRLCRGCEEYRTDAMYYTSNPYRCIPCAGAQQRERLYGINAETYEDLCLTQHRRCAICGASPTDRALSVDHNHRTGRLRGLLCGLCNFGLISAIDEDPSLLDRIIAYREQYPITVIPSQCTEGPTP